MVSHEEFAPRRIRWWRVVSGERCRREVEFIWYTTNRLLRDDDDAGRVTLAGIRSDLDQLKGYLDEDAPVELDESMLRGSDEEEDEEEDEGIDTDLEDTEEVMRGEEMLEVEEGVREPQEELLGADVNTVEAMQAATVEPAKETQAKEDAEDQSAEAIGGAPGNAATGSQHQQLALRPAASAMVPQITVWGKEGLFSKPNA